MHHMYRNLKKACQDSKYLTVKFRAYFIASFSASFLATAI